MQNVYKTRGDRGHKNSVKDRNLFLMEGSLRIKTLLFARKAFPHFPPGGENILETGQVDKGRGERNH